MNFDNNWKARFVWHGMDGNEYWGSISVTDFIAEMTDNSIALELFSPARDFEDLFDKTEKGATMYVQWCAKYETLNALQQDSLRNFFMGAIGELFFTFFFAERKRIYVESQSRIFDFHDIVPRPVTASDYGVDMTGKVTVDNTVYNCVFQSKFWSHKAGMPMLPMTYEIAAKAYCDGVLSCGLDPVADRSIFICWTGSMDRVSVWLKKSPVYPKLVFIDRDVVNQNTSDPVFWQAFADFVKRIN
jgi:hypothetical protein